MKKKYLHIGEKQKSKFATVSFRVCLILIFAAAPLIAVPYLDNSDGTVIDKGTGLVWQKCSAGLSGTDCATGSAATYTWANAVSYCDSLDFAGRTDWRLPNVNELKSITDRSTSSPAIDTVAFPAAVASYYWSSSTYVPLTTNAWLVYFTNGNVVYYNKTGSYYVRCVSSGP
jgi:hypothetical protein